MSVKKHKKMKNYLSLTLAVAISIQLAGASVYAAPSKEQELKELEQQLLVLETKLKAEQEKTAAKKEEQKNPKQKWDISLDGRVKWETSDTKSDSVERARLRLDHDINDKVSFHSRWALMQDNEFGLSDHFNHKINTYNSDHTLARVVYPDLNASDSGLVTEAYLKVKHTLGAENVIVGRFGQTFGATGFWSDEDAFGGIDGIKLTYGKKSKVTVGFANFAAALDYPDFTAQNAILSRTENYYRIKPLEDAFFMNAEVPLSGAVKLHGMVLKEKAGNDLRIATGDGANPWYDDKASDYDLRGAGVTANVAKNLTLLGDYLINLENSSIYLGTGGTATTGINNYIRQEYPHQIAKYASLRYKGAQWGNKGSFGLNFDYRDIDPAAKSNITANAYYGMHSMLFSPYSSNDMTLVSDGIKGPVVGLQFMVDKNIKLDLMHAFNNTLSYYQTSYTRTGTSTSNYRYWGKNTLTSESASNYTSISLSTRF